MVAFQEFFTLFVLSLVNWLMPAVVLSLFFSKQQPHASEEEIELRHGAWFVIFLFVCTIAMAVCAHNFLHLPPVLGMMTGLGLLKMFGYYLKRRDHANFIGEASEEMEDEALELETSDEPTRHISEQYNIFKSIERAEWDTLMFFYVVILSVGGLGALGYMAVESQVMYQGLGATNANILVGELSAVFDNIPVMFSVVAMEPDMSKGQWLLVTPTAGVGGSMLSIGSAAGVAVMGQARGIYTFFSHLKWSWVIALGYVASIWTLFAINSHLF